MKVKSENMFDPKMYSKFLSSKNTSHGQENSSFFLFGWLGFASNGYFWSIFHYINPVEPVS